MTKRLRAYTIYGIQEGAAEAAWLVFHHTAQEARKMGFPHCETAEGWLDCGVKWIQDESIFKLGLLAYLLDQTPHIVHSPCLCESCMFWGQGVSACESCMFWGIGVDSCGMCGWCGEYVGDVLASLFKEQVR